MESVCDFEEPGRVGMAKADEDAGTGKSCCERLSSREQKERNPFSSPVPPSQIPLLPS